MRSQQLHRWAVAEQALRHRDSQLLLRDLRAVKLARISSKKWVLAQSVQRSMVTPALIEFSVHQGSSDWRQISDQVSGSGSAWLETALELSCTD